MKLTENSKLAEESQELIKNLIHEIKGDQLCESPIVTVCILTYAHKEFIEQAINGALIQKINFPYEILIGDDCSTDGTNEIIRKYQNQYPDKIRLLVSDRNLWQPLPNIATGLMGIALLQACRGKYIALCEGDDYWTDPLKLQKQVDFLEANPDFAICFHNVAIINEDYPERNRLNNDDLTPEISTLDNLLEGNNYIATCSAVIKTNLIQNLPDWFTSLPFGDYGLYLIAARHGKIKYINNVMSVYRIHPGGIHGNFTNSYAGLTKAYQQHYQFWRIINQSGMFSSSMLKTAILISIENVIEYAARSNQISIYFKYNYLLLFHGGWGTLGKIAKNIFRLCLYPLRKIKNYFVKTQIKLLK